jgi:putative flippase GtrA
VRLALIRLKRPALLVLVGLAATLIYAGLALLLGEVLPLPAAMTSITAYALAAVASWFGHRRLTFAGETPPPDAPARFAALGLAGYALAFLLPLLLTDMLVLPGWIAIAATCVAVPILNALALSQLVFRAPLLPARPEAGR